MPLCSHAHVAQERTALHAVALWGGFKATANDTIANLKGAQAQSAAVCVQLLVEAGADVNAADE